MAPRRSWTDPRDGKLWLLRHGFGVYPGASRLSFTRGAERRIVRTKIQTELDDFTDEELEALLDQALRVHGTDG